MKKAIMDYLRQHFSDSLLTGSIWLFPLTYALHIGEEYLADFPNYLRRTQGVGLSQARFVVLQSIGLILMTLGIILSRQFQFPNQMLAILATLIVGNSITHMLRSILFMSYEPGLITAILIWLPLGISTLTLLWGQLSTGRYILSAAIGISICCAVELVTVISGVSNER